MADEQDQDNKIYSFPSQQGHGREHLPSPEQRAWLSRGLMQPGGKLPLFDEDGQSYPPKTVRACISKGWAKPWFNNPIKPDWLVCRLTSSGRTILGAVPNGNGEAQSGRMGVRFFSDESPLGQDE